MFNQCSYMQPFHQCSLVNILHKTICLPSNSMSAEGLLFQTCKKFYFLFFSALIIKCCIILFDLVVNPPCQNHRLPQPFQRPISLINICHSTDIQLCYSHIIQYLFIFGHLYCSGCRSCSQGYSYFIFEYNWHTYMDFYTFDSCQFL